MNRIRANLLHHNPDLPLTVKRRLTDDFERFAEAGLPDRLESYILDAYGLDLSTTYAGIPIKNPCGKASGQLSMTPQQVAEDASAGLGFCVLKTVIAEDSHGIQTMSAWAVAESRMVLERIRGEFGEEGWTVSWKGRGWSRSFQEYLEFVSEARQIGDAAGMLVVPSCKYHLPTLDRPEWNMAVEYMLRGCTSFQLHTFFQLPASEYRMRPGTKTAKAMHRMYFDPQNGFIAWTLHVANCLGSSKSSPIKLGYLVDIGDMLEAAVGG